MCQNQNFNVKIKYQTDKSFPPLYSLERSFLPQLFFVYILPGGWRVTNIAQYAPMHVRVFAYYKRITRCSCHAMPPSRKHTKNRARTRKYFSYYTIKFLFSSRVITSTRQPLLKYGAVRNIHAQFTGVLYFNWCN